MRIIAEHSAGKVLKKDALQIGTEAKKAKKLDPTTIDATLGTFYYEGYKFETFPTVKEILNNLGDEKVFSYSPSDGGTEFKEAVLNWVLEDQREEIEKEMVCKVVATPGGTGALSSFIFNSLDLGQTLLIPNLYWGPYVGIANNYGFKVEKFEFFDGDKFNMNSFEEKANHIIERQGKLVTIINDPCNNPTGYSLSLQEIENIIQFMNSKEVPCIFIYDIAYIDYAFEGRKATRKKFSLFNKANSNVMTLVAFSGSKTFSVYGQRLGAQIIMGKDEESVTDYYNAANFTARNYWSNCNHGMLSMLIAFDKNPDLKKKFLKELDEVVKILKERAELFFKEAKEVGLDTHPYHSGFFVTIPVKDNDLVLEKLKEVEKMYLLPFDNSIRLALCSLPMKDIKGLASKIKRVIDSVE